MTVPARHWLAGLAVAALVLALSWDRVQALLGPERIVLAQALATGLLQGGVYALSAMGLTLIFGVLGIINFGHGALVSVGLYLCWSISSGFGVDPYLSLLLVGAATFLIGMLLYRALLAPSLNQPHENQLLLTLAIAIVIENGLKLAFSATPRFVQSPMATTDLRILGLSTPAAWVIAFAGSLAVAGLLHLLLSRTLLGASIRAVASNRTGAMLVGIDVGRIYTLVFGLGAACVGATAVLVAPVVPIEPVAGERFTIVAFVVVVLGGLGSVAGAFIGGLLVGFAQELGGVLFPSQSKLLAVFVVFLCVLFLRPQGLLGKAR
jgi:branched-chain amino acid transport system permease protein